MAARKPSTVHHYSGTGVVGDGFGYVDGGVFATDLSNVACIVSGLRYIKGLLKDFLSKWKLLRT